MTSGLVLTVASLCVSGCNSKAAIRSTDIRRYIAPKEKTLSPAAIARPTRRPAGERPSEIEYDLPAGWTELSGPTGMRLATLAIGDGQEVSIIPAAGTLRSNVERWQKQLDADASAETISSLVDSAMEKAGSVDVQGKKATVVLLTQSGDEAGDDVEAILGGMLPMTEEMTLFVKFKGASAVAKKEQKKFLQFMATLRMSAAESVVEE
ncbi:MAG: hypothetical protein HOB45_06515 [Planctomycetaceae bacterium]|nr:hypothetical protein [Planctomycetaceae bacterium]